ncbi:MAG: C40 family peptidase, partial [Verrucomicrobiae bacterium]|nr:C40 family peptidase [Verrucomicrobiae bacterium]
MRGSGAACACAIAFAVLGILGHPLLASPKPQAQTPAATNPAAAPLPAPVPAPVDGSVGQPPPGAAVSSLAPEELEEFGQLEPRVQELLRRGLDLTQRQLRYQYGSADPAQGGMDCSGTVYYLLNSMGVPNVPRSSDQMYRWAWEQNTFRPVFGHTQESFEFADLRPGDLLFWTGTYSTPNRDPAVSHVMIYLG